MPTHLAGRYRHRYTLADQPPWQRVAVRVDLDGAIVADDAGQVAQRSERRLPAARFQPVRLVTASSNTWPW
jgi:hypothetical protein